MGCRLWWRRAHRQPPAMMGGIALNPDMYIGCIHVMNSSAGLLMCQEYVQKTMCYLLCAGIGAYVAEFD